MREQPLPTAISAINAEKTRARSAVHHETLSWKSGAPCRVSFTVKHERLSVVLMRGIRRRCPRCGEGPLFRRGINAYERCSVCDLVYQPDRGDTWFFMIITDRLPIFAGIIAVYFGFHPQTWPAIAGFFALVALPVVATIRERQGLALALDYFVRTRTEASSA